LGATAEFLDFCSIHVERFLKAHGDPPEPWPCLVRFEHFNANDETLEDARYLPDLVYRQMDDDLVIDEDVGRADKQKRSRFAQVMNQRGTPLAVGSLQRCQRTRHVAVPPTTVRRRGRSV
jgi:hypothetical protein